MVSVQDLLHAKPNQLWTVTPRTTVYEALEILAAKDIGALPVLDGSRLCGIFSERDYARKVVLHGRTSRETTVADLMVRAVVCVTPGDSIQDCMALMTQQRVRHLPVLDGERVVGIVTIGDVVKQVITDQEHTIEQLESYIRGSY